MKTYGLLGKNISYSFSRSYFSEKFKAENISAEYLNFDLQDLSLFPGILKQHKNLSGMNVTIPYKEEIITHLDEMDKVAQAIGAVNTIKFLSPGKLKGYNTDYYGFMESIRPFLKPQHSKALILGTGGASKAVAYAFSQLNIFYSFVSRSPGPDDLSYTHLNEEIMKDFKLIINCTPLGTHPKVEASPPVPTQFLTSQHLIYDLIYNPGTTLFMKKALDQKATVLNGRRMLELQAEKAWEIWNSPK